MRAVVQHGALFHAKGVIGEDLRREQQIRVLDHIHIDGEVGPSQELDGQGVARLLAQQLAPLVDLHAIPIHAASFIGGRISDKSSEAKRSKDAEKYLDKKFDEYIKNKD